MGRAGRKPESVTKDLLYFNEVVDDKRLGLWLKSALKSKENDHTTEETKAEIIYTYVQAWKFIYTIYHGKCLAWSMANFYGGAGDKDSLSCFVSNSPLCTVCMQSEDICDCLSENQPSSHFVRNIAYYLELYNVINNNHVIRLNLCVT